MTALPSLARLKNPTPATAMKSHKPFTMQIVTQNDASDILELYRHCEDFLALSSEPKASIELVLKDLEHSRRDGGVFYGIYDTNGQMIGIVDFVSEGFEGQAHVAFISLLMIAFPHRRHGIGTEIVRLIEKEILTHSQVTEIRSGVQVNNPQALQFWQRNGYQIVGGPELMPDQTTVYHLLKESGKIE